MQNQISIGDILDQHGDRYINENRISGQQKGLIHLLSACRTNGLGSHFERCDHCSYTGKSYDSCRNRHCPACQQKDKLEWLYKRMKELIPVGYYHLVFTLPHELNPMCLQNKKVMYGLLFKAASQTLIELSKDPKHLGADIGLIVSTRPIPSIRPIHLCIALPQKHYG
ncbi:MAG: transposase zinc-binding domain-containing protein [Bacteroidales bacterium]|nr:transposase zinc-binding domain-containing protein [Bacteroidales bacterium]